MNFKRILGYMVAFCFATVILFLGVSALLGAFIGALVVITWSLPVASPFTWGVFRLILLASMIMSLAYCSSKDCEQFVDRLEDL